MAAEKGARQILARRQPPILAGTCAGGMFSLTGPTPLLVDSSRYTKRRFKVRVHPIHKASSRARASSLVLLLLVAHALFVSATHHHAALESPAAVCVESRDGDGSSNQPQSGDGSHCPSCRAARSFEIEDGSHTLMVELPAESVAQERLLSLCCTSRPFVVLSDRAPPLA
jgi:hypothetical protein